MISSLLGIEARAGNGAGGSLDELSKWNAGRDLGP
jgi:hypothetical protein